MRTYYNSRWGFHACSYEDYKKIKLLHKHYWLAKYAEAAYKRYYRKQPQNRVLRKEGGKRLETPIPMPVPLFPSIYKDLLKTMILATYQQARLPRPAEEVMPLLIPMDQINQWLTDIENFMHEESSVAVA